MSRSDELLQMASNGVPLSFDEITELVNLSGVKISRARVWQLFERALRDIRKEFGDDLRSYCEDQGIGGCGGYASHIAD